MTGKSTMLSVGRRYLPRHVYPPSFLVHRTLDHHSISIRRSIPVLETPLPHTPPDTVLVYLQTISAFLFHFVPLILMQLLILCWGQHFFSVGRRTGAHSAHSLHPRRRRTRSRPYQLCTSTLSILIALYTKLQTAQSRARPPASNIPPLSPRVQHSSLFRFSRTPHTHAPLTT